MDPIADMLIRLKNAYRAKREVVIVPVSKIKAEVARVLVEEGYLEKVEKRGKKVRKFLELTLKYRRGQPVLSDVRRISKLSRRVYRPSRELKPVRHGWGLAVVSTSSGVMTANAAKKLGLGGEVICEVW